MGSSVEFFEDDFFDEEDFNEEELTEETETEEDEKGVGTKSDGGDPTSEGGETDPDGAGTANNSEGDPNSESDEGNGAGADDHQEVFSPEIQAKIEAETQRRIDARIAEQYKGKLNPYNGKPITSEADLNAYLAAYDADMRRQQLQDMGIDQKQLQEIVRNLPEVQQARMIQKQQQEQAAKDFTAKEFAALKKEYPDCGLESAENLLDTENGKKTLELWSKGIPMVDAYAATHRAEIRQKQMAAAKQSAMNEMNGKKHLKQTKGGNAKGEVPADVVEGYRMYFPNATMAEIAEMYRKNHEND